MCKVIEVRRCETKHILSLPALVAGSKAVALPQHSQRVGLDLVGGFGYLLCLNVSYL